VTKIDPAKIGQMGLLRTTAVQRLATHGEVSGVAANVTNPQGRDLTLSRMHDAFGGLDILVNNAGGVRAGRLEAISEHEIRAMIEVNLTAPILLTQASRASGIRCGVSWQARASMFSLSIRPQPTRR
jgi:NAD(P)-dependent dehydrogenase (short-subunit alcohol dehydrogenase family)